MPEHEWFTCKDPYDMFLYINSRPPIIPRRGVNNRKMRLFACATARLLENSPPHPERTTIIEVCEQIADEDPFFEKDNKVLAELKKSTDSVWGWVWAVMCPDIGNGLADTFIQVRGNAGVFYRQDEVADLLRDIFYPPHRQVPGEMHITYTYICEKCGHIREIREGGHYCKACGSEFVRKYRTRDAWPWKIPQVLDLTTAAYEERLPDKTLDPYRLLVLADAIEEAGCQEEELLRHLRIQDKNHVRGCWALDVIRGFT